MADVQGIGSGARTQGGSAPNPIADQMQKMLQEKAKFIRDEEAAGKTREQAEADWKAQHPDKHNNEVKPGDITSAPSTKPPEGSIWNNN